MSWTFIMIAARSAIPCLSWGRCAGWVAYVIWLDRGYGVQSKSSLPPTRSSETGLVKFGELCNFNDICLDRWSTISCVFGSIQSCSQIQVEKPPCRDCTRTLHLGRHVIFGWMHCSRALKQAHSSCQSERLIQHHPAQIMLALVR